MPSSNPILFSWNSRKARNIQILNAYKFQKYTGLYQPMVNQTHGECQIISEFNVQIRNQRLKKRVHTNFPTSESHALRVNVRGSSRKFTWWFLTLEKNIFYTPLDEKPAGGKIFNVFSIANLGFGIPCNQPFGISNIPMKNYSAMDLHSAIFEFFIGVFEIPKVGLHRMPNPKSQIPNPKFAIEKILEIFQPARFSSSGV